MLETCSNPLMLATSFWKDQSCLAHSALQEWWGISSDQGIVDKSDPSDFCEMRLR